MGHSRLQALLLKRLAPYEDKDKQGIWAVPEQRVQVKASRFRVADVCVVRGNLGEQVLTNPPPVTLRGDPVMSSVQERIDDYVAFGTENVWIFDPRRKKAYRADDRGVHEAVDGVLEASGVPICIDLSLLWSG